MRAYVAVVAALAVCAFANAQEASVYGMQGLRIRCDTQEKLEFVVSHEGAQGYDFLRVARSRDVPVEVYVAAAQLPEFKLALASRGIEYEVFVDDVSRVIEEELALQRRARMNYRARVQGAYNFKSFPRYSEIKAYLEGLANSRSEIVELFSIGKSYEGRDILAVKISSGGASKPAVVIDAGIHAREWIAPTTALYAVKQLAENASNSYIFDNIDIYVIPSLNPDGYEYTHKSVSTRMWRKTRSNHNPTSCAGVDANRNFEYKWMTTGASSNPCSDTYAGPSYFSEPETSALRDFMLNLDSKIKVYLTFHSYGNYLLHPWGFTSKLPENEHTLRCAAEKAEAALSKIRGTRYTIGSSTNVLYAAAGGSDDWAMARAGAELSYTVELPGGAYGFAPPPKEIIPVGEETFEAVKVFAAFAAGEAC